MGKSTKKIYDLEYTDAFMFGTSHDCKNNRHNMYARRAAKHENSRAIRRWNKSVIESEMNEYYDNDNDLEMQYIGEDFWNDMDSISIKLNTDMSAYHREHTQPMPAIVLPEHKFEPCIIPMHTEYDGLCSDWEVSAIVACMFILMIIAII